MWEWFCVHGIVQSVRNKLINRFMGGGVGWTGSVWLGIGADGGLLCKR